jgi:kumamolisin
VPAGAFHDITLGANGAFTGGPGYDLVAGLGTPDIAKLVSGT